MKDSIIDKMNNIGFEEFILGKGYKKMIYNTKKSCLEEPGKYEIISTMGNMDYRYIKEGFKSIHYGLYEAGKSPVWFYPKPYSLSNTTQLYNDEINKIYQNHTNDEIYESINKNYEL